MSDYSITVAAQNGAGTGAQSDSVTVRGKYTLTLATKVELNIFLACSISDVEKFVNHV